ncbi:MAG: metal-sensitive transcriptional regulator [Sulfobacillus benefaciens]|jgi:DNA-binding FrmR family transcriptional regulator|uniref:Metal-sensitive transcriptional regulator n=1 Tax=Sulfobacillus benefaciens TaxID=453960 RepID=A0A2T2XD17_9FIRM|nr:MAG: metal-sensitive transcriptional regulator [Sulfobacillus benefaciens]
MVTRGAINITDKEHPERPVVIGQYWDTADLIRRMRRIEGQARGIQAMLEREEDCKAILTQLSAMAGALNQVARVVGACGLVDSLRRDASELNPEDIRAVLEDLQSRGRL